VYMGILGISIGRVLCVGGRAEIQPIADPTHVGPITHNPRLLEVSQKTFCAFSCKAVQLHRLGR